MAVTCRRERAGVDEHASELPGSWFLSRVSSVKIRTSRRHRTYLRRRHPHEISMSTAELLLPMPASTLPLAELPDGSATFRSEDGSVSYRSPAGVVLLQTEAVQELIAAEKAGRERVLAAKKGTLLPPCMRPVATPHHSTLSASLKSFVSSRLSFPGRTRTQSVPM